VFCNRCGSALMENASACSKCGALLPQLQLQPQAPSSVSNDKRTFRRWKLAITLLFGAIGIVWDVLAAAILFRTYSFFESVVVCLLVMIICAVATIRADVELWSGISQYLEHPKDGDADKGREPDPIDLLAVKLKPVFYGIAFVMALVKLVLVLIG
jgi:hypothetical protein